MYSADLLRQLPPFMRKSAIYEAMFDADAAQFNIREVAIDDLQTQLTIDTATWGLSIYEHELGVPTDINKPLEERRSVIKSKMRGVGKVGAALIKIVADSYSNGNVSVTFDGTIRIEFISALGIPPNIQDLQNAIEEIKPAHLAVNYVFTYITFGTIQGYGVTYGAIATAGLTFGQLETWKGL